MPVRTRLLAFYQLEQFVEYKPGLSGVPVEKGGSISSKLCCKCGAINEHKHNYTCSRCGYRGHAIIQLVEILAVCGEQLSPLVDIKIIHITTTGGKNNSLKQSSGEFHLLAHPNVGRQEPVSQANTKYLLASDFEWDDETGDSSCHSFVEHTCCRLRLKLKTRSCQTAVRNPGMCWV